MTPRSFDAEVVHARLAEMRRVLDHLERRRGVSAEDLAGDLDLRFSVERMLSLLVDLAGAINTHVASAVLQRAPVDYRESFRFAVQAGAVPPDLSDELIGSIGLRNVLVHKYLEIDLTLVASSVEQALDGYRRYLAAMAGYASDRAAHASEGLGLEEDR